MNDGAPGPDAGTATGETTASAPAFGRPLAAAREALGISVVDMAGRLRLHPRQISAIDDERLDLLPEPAFVRGFIRNYAKEVKLDPAPLLQALAERLPPPPPVEADAPATGITATEVRRAGVERASRLAVIGGTLAVLVVLGLVGWIASMRMQQGSAVSGSAPAPTANASGPAVAADGPGSGAPTTSASPTDAAAAPAPSPAPSSDQSSATPTTAAAAATAPQGQAPALPGSGLRLVVGDRPSWVEITSADGRIALTGLQEAGTERRLANLQPPVRLVIGNASSVSLEYRGKAIDLKPHVRANDLARLTLE